MDNNKLINLKDITNKNSGIDVGKVNQIQLNVE